MGSIVSDVREMAFLGDRRKKGVVFDERGEVPMSKEYREERCCVGREKRIATYEAS
jgi:hypothetical protein